MEKRQYKMSNKRLAFNITFNYVIVATVYNYWAVNNGVSSGVLYYLFIPATFFSSLVIYTGRIPVYMLLLFQEMTLIILWPAIWLVVSLIRKGHSGIT